MWRQLGLRLLVLLLAVGVYLWLLPVQVTISGGVNIQFPDLVKVSGDALVFPEPIHWNYLLLLPVALIIIIVGFELIRLYSRDKRDSR